MLPAVALPSGEQAEKDAEGEAVEVLRVNAAEDGRLHGQLRQCEERFGFAQHRAEGFVDGAAVAGGAGGVQGEGNVGQWRQGGAGGRVEGDVAIAQGVRRAVIARQQVGGLSGDGAGKQGGGQGKRVIAGKALRLVQRMCQLAGGDDEAVAVQSGGKLAVKRAGEAGIHAGRRMRR